MLSTWWPTWSTRRRPSRHHGNALANSGVVFILRRWFEAPRDRADRVRRLDVREAPRRAACRRAAGRLHRPDNPRATAPHRNPERRPGAHRGGADCRRTVGPLLGGCQRDTGGADYEGADAERAVLDRPRSLPTRSSALVVHHGRQDGAASLAYWRIRYDRRTTTLRPGGTECTIEGPTRRLVRTLTADEVIHVRIGEDAAAPWRGVSPLAAAIRHGRRPGWCRIRTAPRKPANQVSGYVTAGGGVEGLDDAAFAELKSGTWQKLATAGRASCRH